MWWRADLRPREGWGWMLTCALPLFLPQGSLPQLPPVDVMAAPAQSWCLPLLLFLLPLPIPGASTAVKGEDPDIRTPVSGALPLGRAIIRGRRQGGGRQGQWDQRSGSTSPFPLCSTPMWPL